MKAVKLKSGSWNCRVFSHIEIIDGKEVKKYKSFTVKDPSLKGKKLCEKMASDYIMRKDISVRYPTVLEGMDNYIKSKENILSPSTIRAYTAMYKTSYDAIGGIGMNFLTSLKIQQWINDMASRKSPKTCKNIVGLLTATFDMYGIDFPKVTLPKREIPNYTLPTIDNIKALLKYCKDNNDADMEIAVMLGAFAGLRRGEICGLQASSVKDGQITIKDNIVRGNINIVRKQPKTKESRRTIAVPDFVSTRMHEKIGTNVGKDINVITLRPDQLTNRFTRYRDKLDLPKFRFHDLRHFAASNWATIMPLHYVEQMGGWKHGSSVPQTIYINTIDNIAKHYNDKANKHFENMLK